MRSSLVVRASDCQCTSCNGPGFDPSIRRHSGIWGAADEAVLNIVRIKKRKNPPEKYWEKKNGPASSLLLFCHSCVHTVPNGSRLARQVWFCTWWTGRTACLFYTVLDALTEAAQLRANGISSCCYLVNVNKTSQPSIMSYSTSRKEGLAW